MNKLICLCIITCILYSCDKDSKPSPISNPGTVLNLNKTDTFSLNPYIVGNCNNKGVDTCIIQRIGDTISISGNLMIVCGFSTVIMTEKNDSILINWCPQKGPVCNVATIACFDLKIPDATNYSIVKFLGITYKGF